MSDYGNGYERGREDARQEIDNLRGQLDKCEHDRTEAYVLACMEE